MDNVMIIGKGKKYMKQKKQVYSVDYIKPLDGVRALANLIVAWFHIWQQSWLQPIKETKCLSIFNVTQINLDWLVRTGYQMVDVMLLLSGFCLFLPYAKSMVYGAAEPHLKQFYKKRVARIMPSYYFAILVALVVALAAGKYSSSSAMWKDLVPHLFFVHTYSEQSYLATNLNVVLWTLAVEVQFYIIFPFLAKLFKRCAWGTYCGMVAVSWMFDNWVITPRLASINLGMWFNQLPTFLCVYANGMMAALIVVKFSQILNTYLENAEEVQIKNTKRIVGYFFTMLMLLSLYVYYIMMKNLTVAENGSVWQYNNRYMFSLVFTVFIVGCTFALSFVQKIFGNRVMKFLSGISFQIYIWHQFLATLFKEHHIPYWTGENPPNMLGDKVWMWKYFILCWAGAIVVATAVTYLIERPCSKIIMKQFDKSRKRG